MGVKGPSTSFRRRQAARWARCRSAAGDRKRRGRAAAEAAHAAIRGSVCGGGGNLVPVRV